MAGTGPGGVFRGSAPRSNPLPFKIPFLTEKVPLPYTFNWYIVPLWHTQFRTLHFSHLQTKMTDLPALLVISWDFLNISKSAKCLKKFPDICTTSFYILQPAKSLRFHTTETWKRYPFRTKPPLEGHYISSIPFPGGKDNRFCTNVSHSVSVSTILFLSSIKVGHWPFFAKQQIEYRW